ncbi:MAG TPA: polysaccharide biosynthesis tyrosine autokinase [Coleofasciculaceae cyanobacterium]|jgi:capsular exopolysaccharide synthesis family protein
MAKSISSLPSVLKRHRWSALATFVSVIGASIAYLVVTPPVYKVTARLMLDEKRVSLSELGRDITQQPSGGPNSPSPIANQAELVRSQRVLKRSVNKVFPQGVASSQGKVAIKELKKDLKVKIVPATGILELSYQDRDPALATKLLNAVSEAMVEESTELIRSEAKAVREFLESEVPKRRVVAAAAEADENRYRQASGIISFEEQTKSLVDSLATLEEQERLLSAQLQETKARVNELQRVTDNTTTQNAYAAGRIGQDEELKDLRTKLAELDSKLSSARSRFTDDNPGITSLLRQRDDLRALYDEKVSRLLPGNQSVPPANIASDELSQNLTSKFIDSETERLALEKKLTVVRAERVELQQRLAQLPLKQQPLTALIRRREEAATSLKLLQSKLEEARIAEAQLVSNVRVIEQAQPPASPDGPNNKVVLVVAIAFGSILAVGIIMLLEMMDNKLRDASELEELLKLPKLGVLPDIPATALSLEQPERFLDNVGLVEPYRLLLKTLNFRTQEKLRLIVVSSTVSGEGKSLVVAHLAAVSAMLSRRTLIIDADLYRPRQHSLLGLPEEPGLTNVIDKEITLLHAVQPTGIENLSILTCGERRDRPASMLESPSMKSLLEEAAAHYDLVIVDTPPVSSSADANALSQSSDGLVMIIRPNYTPKEMLLQTVSELTGNGVPILGVVVNGVTNQNQKHDRYPVKGYQPVSESLKHFTHLGTPVNNSARH